MSDHQPGTASARDSSRGGGRTSSAAPSAVRSEPGTAARLSAQTVTRLRTLDPAGPLDDLGWLDEAIGDARVVAIGESAHYNREFFQLRHRLLRYLAERHGFSAYAMETGFVEGWLADAWVRGGEGDIGPVMAQGLTSLMGLWTELGDQLEWMRRHNRAGARQVGFYGIDLPGSMVSLLPGLDAVTAYLADADPGFRVDPVIREVAAAFAAPSAFSAPAAISAYAGLAAEQKDALTAGLARLSVRLNARRLGYLKQTGTHAYDRAARSLAVTIALDTVAREMTCGGQHEAMQIRDAAMADTVEWILGREDRVVLAAHNGHVQRAPGRMPGIPPLDTLGMHLASRLGNDYRVIGTTAAAGQTLNTTPDFYTGTLFTDLADNPEPRSMDALMAASCDGTFAVDLRRLPPDDAVAVAAVSRQRYGTFYAELSPRDAFDIVIHVPVVTPASRSRTALAHAPGEVQQAFSFDK